MAAARFFLLLAAAAGAVWCGAALIQTHAELHLGDCSLRVSDPEPIPCTRALFGAYGSRQHGAPTTFSLLVPSAVSRAPPSAPRGPGELPHGCSVKDFTPMEPAVEHGRVAAVVRRGKCSFYAKVQHPPPATRHQAPCPCSSANATPAAALILLSVHTRAHPQHSVKRPVDACSHL